MKPQLRQLADNAGQAEALGRCARLLETFNAGRAFHERPPAPANADLAGPSANGGICKSSANGGTSEPRANGAALP